MDSLLAFVYFLSLAAWVGGLTVLFAVVAPTLGQVLSDELGHQVHEQILKPFYALSLVCAVGTIAGLGMMHAQQEAGVPWFAARLGLLGAMAGLTLIAGWFLQPRIATLLRSVGDFDPREDARQHLEKVALLQRLAMQINGSVLLLGLVTLWLSVGGPASG